MPSRTPEDSDDELAAVPDSEDVLDTPVQGTPIQRIDHRTRKAGESIQAVRTEVAAVAGRQAQDTRMLAASIGRVEERLDLRATELHTKIENVSSKIGKLGETCSGLEVGLARIDSHLTTANAARLETKTDSEKEAERRARRNVAIIAIVGPIVSAAIAALAMLAARG